MICFLQVACAIHVQMNFPSRDIRNLLKAHGEGPVLSQTRFSWGTQSTRTIFPRCLRKARFHSAAATMATKAMVLAEGISKASRLRLLLEADGAEIK